MHWKTGTGLGVGDTVGKASPVAGLEKSPRSPPKSKGEGHVTHTKSGQGSSGLLSKISNHEYVVLLLSRVHRVILPGTAGRLRSTGESGCSGVRQMWAPVPVWLLT